MPAEWEPHLSTWISWPKDPTTFPPEILPDVESVYVKMTRALSKGETVNILVDDEKMEKRAVELVGRLENVTYHRIRTADVWMRDYGPIFARDSVGSVVATKWTFNAWGNKYDDLKPDNEAGLRVAKASGQRILRTGMVLEGGSIDTNGLGTCLTTEQCLLNKNRNPSMTAEDIEAQLSKYLGFENFVWLKEGIVGDDTDGHVDDIARFVDENTVVCMVESNRSDDNFEALARNHAVLKESRDQLGDPFRIIPLDMPRKKVGGDERLPASYANFYIGNSAVLVPTFGDVNDSAAVSTLKRVFPGREVIGIDCESLVYGFGGIHCVTQQEPSGTAPP